MHSTRRNPISLPPTPSSALSHHAHFQTISSGKSTAFLQVYWYRFVDHINGSSVTAHAELIFEGNVGLLHKMLHIMHCNQFLGVPPPLRSHPCNSVTQHALLSASTFCTFTQHIKVASWVKGGKVSAEQKWFFTVYEKEHFRLSLKHHLNQVREHSIFTSVSKNSNRY